MRYWWLAVRSVLRAPHVIDHRLTHMLGTPPTDSPRTSTHDAEQAVHLALRMLGLMGRLQRFSVNRWRATCLYRSAVECTILRELGFPARVVIGARIDDATGAVAAHAWVECDGMVCVSVRGTARYEALNAASAVVAAL